MAAVAATGKEDSLHVKASELHNKNITMNLPPRLFLVSGRYSASTLNSSGESVDILRVNVMSIEAWSRFPEGLSIFGPQNTGIFQPLGYYPGLSAQLTEDIDGVRAFFTV